MKLLTFIVNTVLIIAVVMLVTMTVIELMPYLEVGCQVETVKEKK